MNCKPRCPNCPIPYTCKEGGATIENGMRIEMYERPVSLIEYFESACDWTWRYKMRIFSGFVYAIFAVVLYFIYFWR